MTDVHTATLIDDADCIGTVEFGVRKAGTAGWLKGTFTKLALYMTTALASKLVPAGGTTGQVLKKNSGTDFDVGWGADNTGTGGSTNLDGLTDVDTTTVAPTTNDVLTFNGTLWKPAAPTGGGGTTPTPPTIRGSGIQSSSNVNYTVNWPAGTVANDYVFIFIGHAYALNALPTGWKLLDSQIGTNTNGFIIVKKMTAGDITTGSVAIVMTGTYNGAIAVVSIVGTSINGIRNPHSVRSGGGAASNRMFDYAAEATDKILVFIMNRSASTNTFSADITSLQSINASEASANIGYASGYDAVTRADMTANMSVSGSGFYMAVVALR